MGKCSFVIVAQRMSEHSFRVLFKHEDDCFQTFFGTREGL